MPFPIRTMHHLCITRLASEALRSLRQVYPIFGGRAHDIQHKPFQPSKRAGNLGLIAVAIITPSTPSMTCPSAASAARSLVPARAVSVRAVRRRSCTTQGSISGSNALSLLSTPFEVKGTLLAGSRLGKNTRLSAGRTEPRKLERAPGRLKRLPKSNQRQRPEADMALGASSKGKMTRSPFCRC